MTDTPKGHAADLLDFNARTERYMKFVERIQAKRFTTGLAAVDIATRGLFPAEVMTIIAYSGTYKTAYLQHLLLRSAKTTGLYQIFFSMEMPAESVFEREVQMGAFVSGQVVESHYRNISEDTRFLRDKAKDNGSDKLLVCEKPRMSLDKIKKVVEVAQAKYGEVGTIGIDYLGLMNGEGINTFEKMAALSYGVKTLAKELHLPIILLGQVNRGYAQSKGVDIEMDAAKGGGDIEAGADIMFGLMMHEEDLILKILKNRKGPKNIHFKLGLDRETFSFAGAEPWTPPKQAKKSLF